MIDTIQVLEILRTPPKINLEVEGGSASTPHNTLCVPGRISGGLPLVVFRGKPESFRENLDSPSQTPGRDPRRLRSDLLGVNVDCLWLPSPSSIKPLNQCQWNTINDIQNRLSFSFKLF